MRNRLTDAMWSAWYGKAHRAGRRGLGGPFQTDDDKAKQAAEEQRCWAIAAWWQSQRQ